MSILTSQFTPPPPSPADHKIVPYICDSISVFKINLFVSFF